MTVFMPSAAELDGLLRDFGISSEIRSVTELQRYDYEPGAKQVRLIVKAEPLSGPALVVRFKNEADVTLDGVEKQSRFADELRKNGILTPYQYRSGGAFAQRRTMGGYDVIVTVEQFVEDELHEVDPPIAWKTGELLANMHNISEKNDLHVPGRVLFDPFGPNDLFDFASFASLEPLTGAGERPLFEQIVRKRDAYMEALAPLARQRKYAVQGDISDCNLYQSSSGGIGVFDFNRCGDNNLFCDAVMQAVFEARLMDYPEGAGEGIQEEILTAFLKGYDSVRPFTEEQRRWYPYLYALIDGFWSSDIRWDDGSVVHTLRRGDAKAAGRWLEVIWRRLNDRREMPLGR